MVPLKRLQFASFLIVRVSFVFFLLLLILTIPFLSLSLSLDPSPYLFLLSFSLLLLSRTKCWLLEVLPAPPSQQPVSGIAQKGFTTHLPTGCASK